MGGTAQDVDFLWSAAHALMTWRHTGYQELYRIPPAAARSCPGHPTGSGSTSASVWDALRVQLDLGVHGPDQPVEAGLRGGVVAGDLLADAQPDELARRDALGQAGQRQRVQRLTGGALVPEGDRGHVRLHRMRRRVEDTDISRRRQNQVKPLNSGTAAVTVHLK